MSQLELQLGPMFVELVWITGGIDLLFAWELRCFLGENSLWPGWMRSGGGGGGMESTRGRKGSCCKQVWGREKLVKKKNNQLN